MHVAIALSSDPPERFIEREAPRITQLLRWVMASYAYFALLTSVRFPDGRSALDGTIAGAPGVDRRAYPPFSLDEAAPQPPVHVPGPL